MGSQISHATIEKVQQLTWRGLYLTQAHIQEKMNAQTDEQDLTNQIVENKSDYPHYWWFFSGGTPSVRACGAQRYPPQPGR